ncbi:DUF4249 domain-containing protein [Hymenobacter gelipurpurascens]|nr:DUF4249 domain-containing protein [Hymenobacter gelipurpurascens]
MIFTSAKQCSWWVALLLLMTGCVEAFEPKVTSSSSSFLVVDGAINTQGITTIRLSRTAGLVQNSQAPVEGKARVFIEEEGGRQYALTEGVSGIYKSAVLALPAGKQVRLRFSTAGGREYVSDFTSAKATPPIDSITWRPTTQGLQIYVNAHDETQQARYYRWTYDETWQFTSAYQSVLEFRNGVFLPRQEDIFHCWGTEQPSAIKVGTTVKLGQDVVAQQPLALLPQNSVKLRYKYSILVKQYALSPEEYQYWESLRKNTENIGTLFDPLPTQLTGNVHAVLDPAEQVIGFVGAQSVTEKRIFIAKTELPASWKFATGYETCLLDTIPRPSAPAIPPPPTEAQVLEFFQGGAPFPVDVFKISGDPNNRNYYLFSSPDCVDCRKRGTNVRPSFWK